jgi:hypothetical protein
MPIPVPSSETTTFESWQVSAKGILWCGKPGVFSHSFDHQPTRADIKDASGDFEALGPVQVIRIERTTTETHTYSSVA